MSIVAFITELRSQGISIWLEEDRLLFKAPKGVVTAEIKEQLTNRKSELINFLRQSAQQRSQRESLQKAPASERPPLSVSQSALWFIQEANHSFSAYNMYDAVRLYGPLDTTALEKALAEIVKRHEPLRTVFETKDGEPFQRIQPPGKFTLERIDLHAVACSDVETTLRSSAEAQVRMPFILNTGPLFRGYLYEMAPDNHVLLLVMHHAIYDGWSTGVLRKELVVLYTAFSRGEHSPLETLPFQYSDYAHWQQQYVTTHRYTEQVAYWRDRLKGIPSALDLPTDRVRPTTQTFKGQTLSFDIPITSRDSLIAVGKNQECSLFVVLLAAFNVLLCRYSRQEDVVLGIPVSGRNLPETENLCGFFVNMVALRTDLTGDPTFRAILAQVRNSFLDALSYQDVPFEKLVAELQPKRDPSRNPIFQVSFSCDVASTEINFPEIKAAPYPIERGAAHFDMAVFIEETPNGIGGKIEYNSDLFHSETIARFAGCYLELLSGIGKNLDSSINSLPILNDTEKKRLICDYNSTKKDYPRFSCIHQLYEQQTTEIPDATAVVMGTLRADYRPAAVLTYSALNQRANQLAHYLRDLGVGPDVLVGVFMERSLDSIVAILAILKAGGAYVPLDPSYPRPRLAFMLQDTGAPLLITQSSLVADLPQYNGRIINLETESQAIGEKSIANPVNVTSAEHLAYVIYTSGSTGNPKGVCVPHRGVVRLVKSTNYVNLSPSEILLQFAPISFDASTFEIWGSLLNGAQLVVFPPELPTLEQLGQFIQGYGITTLWLTAGLFREMVDKRMNDLRGVRQLLAGGEALSVHHVRRAIHELPSTRLINGYGPTENTTFTCCHTVTAESIGSSVPIGRPIANSTVFILDKSLQPVPMGVPGEMYTGGDGLARGYLNSPELTTAKFIPNPFSSDPTERLYRVGDMVRYLPSGEIEFLGRTDNQVKVRGFRIELGEIENHLELHPSVQQAVVVLRNDVSENKLIVGYIVLRPSKTLQAGELRNFLKERMPDYMVPSAFVTLDRIPLTSNGKVDRKALPAPHHESMDAARNYAAPRTKIEKELCQIWSEIFNLPQVGVDENFFDLGGHSLMTLRTISMINDRLGIRVQPATFFDHPTVAGLCRILESTNKDHQPEVPASVSVPVEGSADLAAITAVVAKRSPRENKLDPKRRYRMREAWICRSVLAPLYRAGSGRVRSFLELVILKLEGGALFTVTLRKLYKQCYDIEIGDYSAGCFNQNGVQRGTKIGRYTGIFPTVMIRNADHPRNTISTHSLFYHPAFGYAKGYELPRMQIEIGNDVWIGHNATILYPTKRIGDGAVIAVGSVVTEDVPPYAIVGGYPATVLRYRFSKEKIAELLKSRWWDASLEELEPVKDQFARPLEGDRIR